MFFKRTFLWAMLFFLPPAVGSAETVQLSERTFVSNQHGIQFQLPAGWWLREVWEDSFALKGPDEYSEEVTITIYKEDNIIERMQPTDHVVILRTDQSESFEIVGLAKLPKGHIECSLASYENDQKLLDAAWSICGSIGPHNPTGKHESLPMQSYSDSDLSFSFPLGWNVDKQDENYQIQGIIEIAIEHVDELVDEDYQFERDEILQEEKKGAVHIVVTKDMDIIAWVKDGKAGAYICSTYFTSEDFEAWGKLIIQTCGSMSPKH